MQEAFYQEEVMKAWRLIEAGMAELKDMESQPVGDECVKIKLIYSAITIIDRLLYHGQLSAQYPLILGRQASGMVVEVGSEVKGLVRGDIVAVKPLSICGSCIRCKEGKFNECENQLTFGLNEDGFLRDFAVLNAYEVVKLPERVSPKDATFIDYINISIEAISKLNLEKGQYLIICGASELGIVLAQVAMYYQIIPILIDINPAFLNLAKELGVYYTINCSEEDAKKRIFALTGGKMADGAAYITAASYPFAKIFEYVKCGGMISICGLEKSKQEINVNASLVFNKKLTVVGIPEDNNNIASAINLLANKTVQVDKLIGNEICFDEVNKELKKEIDANICYLKTLVKI